MVSMKIAPWMTKVLMVVALALGYLLHKKIIPPGYEWHGISIAGVATDFLVALSGIGISGPQTWAWLAGVMGNPGAAKTTPAVPPTT
jgi:hypothetical protein